MGKIKTIRLWFETTEGVIPTSPKCYLIKLKDGAAINESQSKQRNDEQGNDGEASAPSYGASDFTVSMPFILGTKVAPLIARLLYSEATTVADASGVAWSAALTVAKGDIVNHSDGVSSLVASNAGTTGGSEPTIPVDAKTGKTTIDDNGVIWYYTEKLIKYDGQNKQCLGTFGIEFEEQDCAGSPAKYRRALGCRVNSSPTGQTGDANSYDMTLDGVAMNLEDSNNPGVTYEEMSAKAGYTEVDLRTQEFYNYEDSSFLINDVKSTKVMSYSMTTTRNATTENLLNQEKESNIGIIDPSGTLDAYFDPSIWNDAYLHTDFKATLEWQKPYGSNYICINPQVKPTRANPTYSTAMKTKIEGLEIDAYGTPDSPSCVYSIIAPVTL